MHIASNHTHHGVRQTAVLTPFGSTQSRFAKLLTLWLSLCLFGISACTTSHKRPVRNPDRWAHATIKNLSLAEKVGQLIVASTPSRFQPIRDSGYASLVEQVRQGTVGGLVFMAGTPHAQWVLAQRLQRETDIPLLLAQDVEHGVAMRIQGATEFPSMMALGAANDPELARRVGQAIGEECRLLGINLAFAPVLDLNSNPNNPVINVRSFGSRPAVVAELGSALIAGLRDGGVLATAKHFPGHGDTRLDSHYTLPVLGFSREEWLSMEAIPFRAAVDRGVDGIMMGHLAWPAVDASGQPATLSPTITEEILRRQWGFEGLIITDAMNMGGLTQIAPAHEAAVQAVRAGADVILMPPDPIATHQSLLAAVQDGRISSAELDQKVLRILRYKARFAHQRLRSEELLNLEQTLNPQNRQSLAQEAARAGLTFLGNPDVLAPDQTSNWVHVSITDRPKTTPHRAFQRLLDHYSPTPITHFTLTPHDGYQVDPELWKTLKSHSTVVLSLFSKPGRTLNDPDLIHTLNRILHISDRSILNHFGHPALPAELSRPKAMFLAYGMQRVMLEQTARTLFGEGTCSGRLPVRLPGHYPRGAGMDLPTGQAHHPNSSKQSMLGEVDRLMAWAIDQHIFPGAVVAVGNHHGLRFSKAYGAFDYQQTATMQPSARFDLASLTKIIATTTVTMRLLERKLFRLDDPVGTYLPTFGKGEKAAITIRDLLRHTSGFRPYYPFHRKGFASPEDIWRFIEADPLQSKPGSTSRYSDFNMLILARLLSEISQTPFAELCRREVFEPLALANTGFLATGTSDPCVVPTEWDEAFRGRLVQGEIHDETAYLLGGTAGHAGLFSHAGDLSRFALMILNQGETPAGQFLTNDTLTLFTTAADNRSTRALGWDTRGSRPRSPGGQRLAEASFGHTGFTGTSIWIDRERDLFIILLTNRVHPSRSGRGIVDIRAALADIVASTEL